MYTKPPSMLKPVSTFQRLSFQTVESRLEVKYPFPLVGHFALLIASCIAFFLSGAVLLLSPSFLFVCFVAVIFCLTSLSTSWYSAISFSTCALLSSHLSPSFLPSVQDPVCDPRLHFIPVLPKYLASCCCYLVVSLSWYSRLRILNFLPTSAWKSRLWFFASQRQSGRFGFGDST